jgi:threonyl-tRNA synthetase editing subunit
MKLLMIYCSKFAYNPTIHTLKDFPLVENGSEQTDSLVAFIHAEFTDEEDPKGIENKLLKNIKWAAKKNNTKNIILHSFAHLAETKANPLITKDIFNKVELRLKNADYNCCQTPFGHFLDLDIQAPGVSQARIFKGF